ncbi:hypothetical protein D3C87_1423260 [compost metagenome]
MTDQHNAAQAADRAEAEAMARIAVTEYVNACCPTDRRKIANYLMKLTSVSAVVMAQVEGSEESARRLEATAAWFRKRMPHQPAKMETVQ